MKLQRLIMTPLALLGLAACHKDNAEPVKLSGTYTGIFKSTSPNAASGTVKLVVTDKTYLAELKTFMRIESRGTYIIDNNQITFKDSTAHTANFDWSLLLNGVYEQSAKNDSLILVKKGEGYSYMYRLKKQ